MKKPSDWTPLLPKRQKDAFDPDTAFEDARERAWDGEEACCGMEDCGTDRPRR